MKAYFSSVLMLMASTYQFTLLPPMYANTTEVLLKNKCKPKQVRCTGKSWLCSHPRPPASGEGCLFRSEELYPLSLGPCSAEANRLCNEWALNGILPARFGHFSSSVWRLLNKPNPFLGSKLPKPETLPLEVPGPLCCLCIELRDPLTCGISLVFQVAEE